MGRGLRDVGPGSPGFASMRMARKSLTLVRVAPVTIEAPSALKKPWPSLSARACAGLMRAQARAQRLRADAGAGDVLGAVHAIVSAIRAWMRGWSRSAMPATAGIRHCVPPLPWPRTVTVVSPPDSSTQGGRNGCSRSAACSDAGLADVARLALQRVAEDVGVVAGLARHGGGRLQRHLRRGRHADLGARQARSPGLTDSARPERSASSAASGRAMLSAARCPARRRRWWDRRRWGRTRCPADGRPARRTSTGDDPRRMAGRRQPAALIADRWRRTQFISLMVAPLASSAG